MQLNGIAETNLQAVATELSKLLADEFILYVKTKNAHWNVEDPNFHSLHTFFEGQFDQLDGMIDEIAERIRSIGHYAPATLTAYLALAHLTGVKRPGNSSNEFIEELLQDHEHVIMFLRQHLDVIANQYKDPGTGDFVTGILKAHEKMAWMLRAHLR